MRPADHESTFDRAKPIALGLVLAVLGVLVMLGLARIVVPLVTGIAAYGSGDEPRGAREQARRTRSAPVV